MSALAIILIILAVGAAAFLYQCGEALVNWSKRSPSPKEDGE